MTAVRTCNICGVVLEPPHDHDHHRHDHALGPGSLCCECFDTAFDLLVAPALDDLR